MKYEQETGYSVYVLGKNGEPKAKKNIRARLYKACSSQNQISDFDMQTDNQGAVHLGDLRGISKVTIEL